MDRRKNKTGIWVAGVEMRAASSEPPGRSIWGTPATLIQKMPFLFRHRSIAGTAFFAGFAAASGPALATKPRFGPSPLSAPQTLVYALLGRPDRQQGLVAGTVWRIRNLRRNTSQPKRKRGNAFVLARFECLTTENAKLYHYRGSPFLDRRRLIMIMQAVTGVARSRYRAVSGEKVSLP